MSAKPDVSAAIKAIISVLAKSPDGLEVDELIGTVVKQSNQDTRVVRKALWDLIDTREVTVGWDTRLRRKAEPSGSQASLA